MHEKQFSRKIIYFRNECEANDGIVLECFLFYDFIFFYFWFIFILMGECHNFGIQDLFLNGKRYKGKCLVRACETGNERESKRIGL